MIKKFIPNAITLLNALCGSIAVIFIIENNFVAGAFFVLLGIFFDFFDGFFARKLNVQSELGIQLDSLADMITSGLAPGLVMYKLLGLTVDNPLSISNDWNSSFSFSSFSGSWLPVLGLLITLASCYRLAKFNLDEDQQTYFKGLPTPANALLILSLPLIMEFENNDIFNTLILNKWFLIALTLVSSYLLNSNIKLFALKFKDYRFKNNAIRYLFILLALVILIILGFAGVPVVIALYIILSILNNFSTNSI